MKRSSISTDSILGKGYSPNYGLIESSEMVIETKGRWIVAVVCSLSACIASLQAGMSLSFSSIVINELSKSSVAYTDDWKVVPEDGNTASIIGVSVCSLTVSGFSFRILTLIPGIF